ncbi:MAG: hypothetical protein ACXVNM_07180 [Bacteroidia bacterium]
MSTGIMVKRSVQLPRPLIPVLFFVFSFSVYCQPQVFKEVNKWGIKQGDNVIVKPVYDTVFNFDSTGKVCLACNKTKTPSANRYIKTSTVTFNCNYLSRNSKRLMVIPYGSDTACSIFTLNRQSVQQYHDNPRYFIASIKNRKFLISKDFKQITFKEYAELYYMPDSNFIMTEIKTEGNMILKGLIDLTEKEIVPMLYSNVKINSRDSLIVACSAGVGANREDDIYNFSGKKVDSYKRHIDMATKKYIIFKIFEPKEYYIIYNLETKEEKIVYSEEAQLFHGDELLMRNDDHWFTYDMSTNKKKAYDAKHKKN